jgi:hypothetical protein
MILISYVFGRMLWVILVRSRVLSGLLGSRFNVFYKMDDLVAPSLRNIFKKLKPIGYKVGSNFLDF